MAMSNTATYDTLEERRVLYVVNLVQDIEGSLKSHLFYLKGEIQKANLPKTKIEKICRNFGTTLGFLLGVAQVGTVLAEYIATPVYSINESTEMGIMAGDYLGEKMKSDKHLETANGVWHFIRLHVEQKINFRKELIRAAWEIFESFQHQFRYVHNNHKWREGIIDLAKAGALRAIDYCSKEDVSQIGVNKSISEVVAMGVVSGNFDNTIIRTFDLEYKRESLGKKWRISSLYDKAGIVIEKDGIKCYFEKDFTKLNKRKQKEDKKSTRPEKYGYRRLLRSEDWTNMKEKFRESNESDFQDYNYESHELTDEMMNRILKEIESNLPDEIMKEILDIVRDQLIQKMDGLKESLEKYHNEDLESLSNIKTNLQKINMDHCLEMIKKEFEVLDKKLEQNTDKIIASTSRTVKATETKLLKGQTAIKKEMESVRFNIERPANNFEREELKRLADLIKKNRNDLDFTVVITGSGGMGKTELVKQYIKKHASEHYDNIVWIDSGNEAELMKSFVALAVDNLKIDINGISDGKSKLETILAEVYKILKNKNTLIIFDNAKDTKTYKKFLRSGGGQKLHLLITSRQEEWESVVSIFPLGVFSEAEGMNLVKSSLKITSEFQDSDIEKLLKKLQYYPLGINQAIAYIQYRNGARKDFGITDYLIEFVTEEGKLFDSSETRVSEDPYERITYINMELITNFGPFKGTAFEILRKASYLAPQRINSQMFLPLLEEINEKHLRKIIGLLSQFSMVTLNENETFNVNELIQYVTRRNVTEYEIGNVIHLTCEIFRGAYPMKKENNQIIDDLRVICEALPHYEMLLEHSKGAPEKQLYDPKCDLITIVGAMEDILFSGYRMLGNFTALKTILDGILIVQEKYCNLNQTDHSTLATLASTFLRLAAVCGELGFIVEQRKFLGKRSKINEDMNVGEDDDESLAAMSMSRIAYDKSGEVEEEIKVIQKKLSLQGRKFGFNSPEVAETKYHLATAYEKLARKTEDESERLACYLQQKDLLEEALSIQQANKDTDPLEIAQTLTLLGHLNGILGNGLSEEALLNSALKYTEKSHDGKEKSLQIATIKANFGSRCGRLGQYNEQIEYLAEALTIYREYHRSDDPHLVPILNNLVIAYRNAGQLSVALQYYAELISIKNNCPEWKFE